MATTTATGALEPGSNTAASEGASTRRRMGMALLLLVLLVAPIAASKLGLLSNFMVLQLSLMIVYAIAVLGLNLLTGYNGQISLGHGAFFAIGAYVAAVLIDRYDLPWWTTLPLAGAACFLAGYLFGLPALRLEGHYLALATFSLAIAVPQILKYKHLDGLTGGVQGINLIKPDAPFGLPLNADQWMYLVVFVVAVFMFWMARNLLDSRIGRALMAIRDHTMAASTMGINIAQTKAITFGISALYVGVAGALHAIIFEFVAPDSFRIDVSISLLVGMVVGGVASLAGSVIGGIFVQVIEKYADAGARMVSHALHLPIDIEPWTIYGIALILLVYVMPTGIAGGLAALWGRIRRRSGL
ncbi:MAG: branched-chain amino acid ABC transporter permease [Hyphomicrobiaceae bacterium]|nr:branched-chain amino acid ABC transporter permease [Hyphomicrobiaceae bacterium]